MKAAVVEEGGSKVKLQIEIDLKGVDTNPDPDFSDRHYLLNFSREN